MHHGPGVADLAGDCAVIIDDFTVIDCTCGLRYGRTMVPLLAGQAATARCVCGDLLGEWSGAFSLLFEPEDKTGAPAILERRAH